MYFITTIEHLPKGNYKDMGSTRCVGYYKTFEDANECVVNNNGDIWEYLYDYCVIEKIEEGLYRYAFDNDRHFYKFNLEIKKYDPIDAPEEFDGIVGLSIG
jgi:hypothetical protein